MIAQPLHREQLWNEVGTVIDALTEFGVKLPSGLKRRDKREPGRQRKEAAELRMYRALRSYWRGQAERIREKVETRAALMGMRFDATPPTWWEQEFDEAFWKNEDKKLTPVLLKLNSTNSVDGVTLFAEGVRIGMDYTLTNSEAEAWAREYTFGLVKDINNTTRTDLRNRLTTFINTPGYTIGDLMSSLPFNETRARAVSITEVTRAYAQGNMVAGKQLKKEFPDVRVVKTWYTNNDDLVCEICEPLDGMEVELDEGFTTAKDKREGLDGPPAHVNCRCWMRTTTKIRK